MKKTFTLACLLFLALSFASSSNAQSTSGVSYSMPAIEVGFKWNTMDITNSTSNKQEVGFQLGASTVFNLSPTLGLRTGLFYTERPFNSEVGSQSVKGKVTYFEVPAHVMFKFEDYAGIYIGPALSVKLGDEINSPNRLSDVKGILTPITFGAQFKFLPNLGANIFFEVVPGEIATDIKNSRAVGANLLFTFD